MKKVAYMLFVLVFFYYPVSISAGNNDLDTQQVEEKNIYVNQDAIEDGSEDENNDAIKKEEIYEEQTNLQTDSSSNLSTNLKLVTLSDINNTSFNPVSFKESATSKLGRIQSSSAKIYKTIGNETSSITAGTTYIDKIFYIKKQAEYNNQLYYLISTVASDTRGVIGWVKASDMWAQDHVAVDHQQKTFYLKGTGWSYTDAWGAGKNVIYNNLTPYKDSPFKVNLTEKVGNAIWYRGLLNGRSMWIQAYNVTTDLVIKVPVESATSKLGRIQSSSAKIYKTIGNETSSITAGTTYTDKIFYIKKQATLNNQLYYLISTVASDTRGVIGWVKASDMWAQGHVAVDHQQKTFYLKGTGWSYTDAWGAGKNVIYNDLTPYKDSPFKVNLTEKVGNAIWYRGLLDGKSMWIQAYNVSTLQEKSTSKLGRIETPDAKIYKTIGDEKSSITSSTTYIDKVFYIKKQATLNNQLYYLISTVASDTRGVIGWIKASDMWAQDHVVVDHRQKTFYLKGTGWSYTDAWGASKDVIYNDLTPYQDEPFRINLTEKVGDAIWYRGLLNGKSMWIQAYNVKETNTKYTYYDITLQEAVNLQMTRSPQTDKYRNKNAFIPSKNVVIGHRGLINGDGVRLRTAPNFENNIFATVNKDTGIIILGETTGTVHEGSSKWYQIRYNGQTLYVHTSLANKIQQVYLTHARTNIFESENENSHVYANLAIYTELNVVGSKNGWYEIKYGAWRNAKPSDVIEYLDPTKNDQFQHLLLTSSVGVSATELNKVLVGKGILTGRGEAFIEGAKTHKINEIYLISHALLETGHGTSDLSRGIEVGKNKAGVATVVTSSNRSSLVDIKTVYNMFGIGAYDSCARTCGAQFAYNQGWFSPEKAIIGGAEFIGRDYIHNQYNQNTLYKMRWNFVYTPKQYATDVGWAIKQVGTIKDLYSKLTNPMLIFDIPVFK